MATIAITKHEAASHLEFWFNRYQGFAGAFATLVVGYLAYHAAVRSVSQAERADRDSKMALLDERIARANIELDALMLAPAYLDHLATQFPQPPNSRSYVEKLRAMHFNATDHGSRSAENAPQPFGPQVKTVVGRLSALGDRISEMEARGMTVDGIATAIGPTIIATVEGLEVLASTMRNAIPRFGQEISSLRLEREALTKMGRL